MDFKLRVIEYIKKIPRGKVVSYGQVAVAAGNLKAPRQVGMILRYLDINRYSEVPWWRVINSQGIISIKGNWTATRQLQKEMLLKEGVEIDDFKIRMDKFRWKIP